MSFFFYHSCGGCFLISVFTQNGQRNDFNVWLKSHIDAKFQGESNGEVRLALSSLENEILAKKEHMSKTHLQQLGPWVSKNEKTNFSKFSQQIFFFYGSICS